MLRKALGHVCSLTDLTKFKNVDLCVCGEIGDVNHAVLLCSLYDSSFYTMSMFYTTVSFRFPFATNVMLIL